jgi:eukaryotic-like serine/threonine-protein kinase
LLDELLHGTEIDAEDLGDFSRSEYKLFVLRHDPGTVTQQSIAPAFAGLLPDLPPDPACLELAAHVILSHGTGARDYQVLDELPSSDAALRTLRQLLEARKAADGLALLNAAPFQLFQGTNDFQDEFSLLYATLPVEAYERLRRRVDEFKPAARELREVLEEVGVYARFVVVDVETSPPKWSPDGYDCEPECFAQGGYAEVYRATHLNTGRIVALKRSRSGDTEEARARLRREIQEQRRIDHRHVMPILDHDPEYEWFTMPLADGTFADLRAALAEDDILTTIDEVASGIEAAHSLGLVHRDITPRNILRLTAAEDSRWMVSDWGLVRRPHGMTSTMRTFPGQPFGTQGFVAPEVANDGHVADARSDVYSLGRVLGFGLTGQLPSPNLAQNVTGRWRYLVQRATSPDASRRIQSMADFRAAIRAERAERAPRVAKTPLERASELSEQILQGTPEAADGLLDLALENAGDADLWLDYVASVPREAIDHLMEHRRGDASAIVDTLLRHLTKAWGRRDYDKLNVPLQRMLWITEEAVSREDWGLLEDAARALFAAEVHCQRYKQRDRSRVWLAALRGEAAATIARVLSSTERIAGWYLEDGWRPTGLDPVVRAALR